MGGNTKNQSRERSLSLIGKSAAAPARERSKSVSSGKFRSSYVNGQPQDQFRKGLESIRGTRSASRPRSPSESLIVDCQQQGPGSDTESISSDIELDPLVDEYEVSNDEENLGLAKHNRKRRRRKKANTWLDDSVASITKAITDEKETANSAVVRRLLVNVVLICLWYLFSILISLYNKWMFSSDNLNFKYPLFTTSLHMLVQFAFAGLVLAICPSLQPRRQHINSQGRDSAHSSQSLNSQSSTRRVITKWFYFTRLSPCGIATALDIGLGNMSLKFISLTFNTMCKSSALGFVLMFAFLFGLEIPSWKLTGVIAVMTVGVTMMVAGETEFKFLGFILIMMSALSSGFRWSLTQILLLRHPATANPFSSIFLLAPIMFMTLIMLAIPVEGIGALRGGLNELANLYGNALGLGILLLPGAIAFCMTSAEFALLKRTSVVTLSICGIFKEVLTISAASITLHERLTLLNVLGLMVTIISIAAYNYIKIQKMHAEAQERENKASEHDRQSSNGNSNLNDLEEIAEDASKSLLNRQGHDRYQQEHDNESKSTGLMRNSLLRGFDLPTPGDGRHSTFDASTRDTSPPKRQQDVE